MITKTEFAEHLLEKCAGKDGFGTVADMKANPKAYIYQSSTCAVALEYLGLLKSEDLKEYVSSRGGVYILTSAGGVVSVREMFDLLPDKL